MARRSWRDVTRAVRDAASGAIHRMRNDDAAPPVGAVDPPPGVGGTGTWQERVWSGPNSVRRYALYTPPGRAPLRGAPLLVLLHGCRQGPADIATATRANTYADRHRYVVAYPQQEVADNRRRCWNWFLPRHQQREHGEPSVIAQITADVVAGADGWRIDPRRVYVAGLSAGGAMASVLGATHPDVFTAVGVHSGVGYRAATNLARAYLVLRAGRPDVHEDAMAARDAMGLHARVVPVIVVHGDADETVAPINGAQTVTQWMDTNRAVADGAYEAELGRPARTERIDGARPSVVRRWTDRRGAVVQEYHLVEGLGHAWSGGSPAGSFVDPDGPDATAALFAFFARHRR